MRWAPLFVIGSVAAFNCTSCASADGSPDHASSADAGADGPVGSGGAGGGGGAGGETPGCGPAIEGGRCTPDGWCWDAPHPHGEVLLAIHGTADATSVWAVGSRGAMIHRCAQKWVAIESGTMADLTAVWTPSSDYAVAVGASGTILRWDGSSWTSVASPTTATLRTVWGTVKDDVWIAGDADEQGTCLLHYDGNQLTREDNYGTAYDLYSISGRSADDFFVVGGGWDYPRVIHRTGSTWEVLQAPDNHDPGPLRAIVTETDGTAVALLDGFTNHHLFTWTGSGWTNVDVSSRHPPLFIDDTGMAAFATATTPSDIWRRNGADWVETGDTLELPPNAVWQPLGDEKGWAVGSRGGLMDRSSSGTWSQVPEFKPIHAKALGGKAIDDLWMITDRQILHRNSQGWQLDDEIPSGAVIDGAALDSEDRPYLWDSQSGLWIRDGGTWKSVPFPEGKPWDSPIPFTEEFLAGSPNDIWVLDTSVWHFDGTTWVEEFDSYACGISDSDIMSLRRAPDGSVYAALGYHWGAAILDPVKKSCTRLPYAPSLFDTGRLEDLAWPTGSTSDMWGITRDGRLIHQESGVLVEKANIASALGKKVKADELVGVSGKLRLTFYYDDSSNLPVSVWIDPSSLSLGTPLTHPYPYQGYPDYDYLVPIWTPDEEHAVLAARGGVVRRGYSQ